MGTNKPWQNSSGCNDPTAYAATKPLAVEEQRMVELIRILKTIIKWSGFELMNRIEIRGASGRIYK